MLRMKESSHLYKEPRYDHLFTKKIVSKINIPNLTTGNNYNLNITGFNSVASFGFIFIRDQENDLGYDYFKYKYMIDDVSIQDGTGKNILHSDLVSQKDYNRYQVFENFGGKFAILLNKLSTIAYNNGSIFFMPFGYNAGSSFNDGYNGGYAFKSGQDYKIKFKSNSDSGGKSVILYIVWFTPALLSLENNDLSETQN